MEEELKTIYNRKVWQLESLPANTTPIGCRWVYTVKRDELGKIAKFKARLVAQGFKQVKGESYEETFSPVVNFSVVRFFFALLVSFNRWFHIQCDVTGAYLYAPLTENIYMSQPPGFEKQGQETKFCKLNKALYGLHQSGRQWFYEIHGVLLQIGFNKFEWCNCAYTFGSNIVLILYVDDFVIFGKYKKEIDNIIEILKTHFDLKILGRTRKLLGVEFVEERNNLLIHQETYIDEVYNKFKDFCIPIHSLPITKGSVFSKLDCPSTDNELNEMSHYPYRSLLGCLSFLSNRTRPDISYAVNILSQFQSNPGIKHWSALVKLLGYVIKTRKIKLNLTCNNPQIITYSDADFAANRDDRTSLGGQLVLLGTATIGWRTFKEKCVSLSTMEAEFVAMTEATKETIWFNRILVECFEKEVIQSHFNKPILYVDNRATIDFVKSPIENYRSKHIDVKLFFVRDLVYKDIFNLKYICSKENLADIFTKPMTKNDLEKFVNLLFK